jgi:protein TonB
VTHAALRPDSRPAGRAPSTRLGSGIAASLVVHVALVALVFWWGSRPEPARPPVYRVELVGQLGPRRVGVEKSTDAAAPAPEAAGAERVPEEKAAPTTKAVKKAAATPKATPSPAKSKKAGDKTAPKSAAKSAPKAGAGATGGKKGADVANVKTDGIEFPYPGYLNNIMRQIALNWSPSKVSAALVTEVKFTIRRDGSVMAIQVVKKSGDVLYDADATGAIEAVGTSRSFGPLPSGWKDDVLVVYFTFDYSLRPK